MNSLLLMLVLLSPAMSMTMQNSASEKPRDTYSDTWVATDALGRKLPGYAQVGAPRKDRTVALFYFLWHGPHVNGGPYDITKITAQSPTAMQNANDPLWGPMYVPHHWGEPLFGYYLTDDNWVLHKHARMLADAGVDTIVFDATNQLTYPHQYTALCKAFSEVCAAGGKTPQIAFLCPFGDPTKVARELFHDLYEPGLYKDLWFRWKGKPLLLADPAMLDDAEGTTAQNMPVKLAPGHTLTQTLTSTRQIEAVGGRFPTWESKTSAMTLTLYREGATREKIASHRYENIADNSWLSVRPEKPLPPGTYSLEMSEPRGNVGWWSHTEMVFAGGKALADGNLVGGSRTLRIEVTTESGKHLKDFFTVRKPQPDYFQGPTGPDMWSWLEIYPQHVFRNSQGQKEQMSVGVAQNAVDTRLGNLSDPRSRGRNWHNGANDSRPGVVDLGLNFSEQFERALKEDPELIFITGWNEWIAGRFAEFAGAKQPVMFVDEFNQEYSRDIEPMKGGHGDDYYYQMIEFIRRYKGVRKPPVAGPPKTITLAGDFSEWESVAPEYRDDVGDVVPRDHPGWNNVAHYVNRTGRNDFVRLKVARDAKNIYFFAETKDPITPHTDPYWMLLFIDSDRNAATGWHGYDYVVNLEVKSATDTTLMKSAAGWNWKPVTTVSYKVDGNRLTIRIPRSAIGQNGKHVAFDFHWADNIQKPDDIDEFIVSGDSAPNNRFNYRYETGK